jgi:hypothetical protein
LFAVDVADPQRLSRSSHVPVTNPWAHSITQSSPLLPHWPSCGHNGVVKLIPTLSEHRLAFLFQESAI